MAFEVHLALWLLLTRAPTTPGEEWDTSLWPPSRLQEAITEYAFPQSASREKRHGRRTDAAVVVHGGRVVYEKYWEPYTAQKRHHLWSVSKSVAALVTGCAEDSGLIHRTDIVDSTGLQLQHLLQWSSGKKWSETYEYNPVTSSVIAMLYTNGSSNMGRFFFSLPQEFAPGTHYRYSSGDSNAISYWLSQKMPAEKYDRYPWEKLFAPLQMSSVVWERDREKTWISSSYLYMTARDLARIGLLVSRNGKWKDKQIISSRWLDWSKRVSPAYKPKPLSTNLHPTAQWWVNFDPQSPHIDPAIQGAPTDLIAAQGHWGQSLIVVPSRDLVVVRFADDRDNSFDLGKWIRTIIDAAEFYEQMSQSDPSSSRH